VLLRGGLLELQSDKIKLILFKKFKGKTAHRLFGNKRIFWRQKTPRRNSKKKSEK